MARNDGLPGGPGIEAIEKICVSCGRRFALRRRRKGQWSEVRYCSRACGKRGIRHVDRQLEHTLLALLESGCRSGVVYPSEVARVVSNGKDWQPLEEYARRAARRLAHRGLVEILQGGRVVEPSDFRGPIRVRFPRR